MKVALVHDWLVVNSGAEKVLSAILEEFPDANIFTIIDTLKPNQRAFLKGANVTSSFVQNLPFARKHFRKYLALMPLAIESLDVSGYDIIISSSHAVAKGVRTSPDQLHVCYCHTPMRYAWDMQHQYLNDAKIYKGVFWLFVSVVLQYLRLWDFVASSGVNYFIANSEFVRARIKKYYFRDSVVIYPPVDVDFFEICSVKDSYYLTASRLVPYKNLQLIVRAFNKIPDKKLIVIGDGPEFLSLKKIANQNIQILGYQDDATLKKYLMRAKGFVFAAVEDFGIAPVEAQACGTPVIAYARGGALETIVGLGNDMPTGIFYDQLSEDSLIDAITRFEAMEFSSFNCRSNSEKFSKSEFKKNFRLYIDKCISDFFNGAN